MVDVQMIIKASTVANTSHDEQIRFGLSCGIKPSCCCGDGQGCGEWNRGSLLWHALADFPNTLIFV
jgi:hypothetical protein